MFPNEYVNRERHKDLLHEADHRRLAHEFMPPTSLTQQFGQQLLKLSIRLAMRKQDECTTVETRGQVVTVCAA